MLGFFLVACFSMEQILIPERMHIDGAVLWLLLRQSVLAHLLLVNEFDGALDVRVLGL